MANIAGTGRARESPLKRLALFVGVPVGFLALLVLALYIIEGGGADLFGLGVSLATGLVVLAVAAPFYFVPSMIAAAKKHRQLAAIAALNACGILPVLLLGTLGLVLAVAVWIGALVWSMVEDR